jgi:hypothetical protein
LVAAVVSSAFSWPTIQTSPWTAKATFYATLFVSLCSVATASQQSIALNRYGRHPAGLKLLQARLKQRSGSASGNKANFLQLYVWQMPVMLLNVSIALFLIGLVILLWAAAAQSPAWDADMKVLQVCLSKPVTFLTCGRLLSLRASLVFCLFLSTQSPHMRCMAMYHKARLVWYIVEQTSTAADIASSSIKSSKYVANRDYRVVGH